MKKLNFKNQKHIQILAVIGLSFLLHACGNKDTGSTTAAVTYYGVAADQSCWASNGQRAAPQSCMNAPYIKTNGQCVAANGQPLPSIRSCTPSGWYMEMGVCKNGDYGAYAQQQQQYGGYQQPYAGQYAQPYAGQYAQGQCGAAGSFNQQYGYNPQTGTFNTQQYGQQYQYQQQYQQPYQQQYYQQPYQQQYYQQPSSYWSTGGTWSSGYVPYTGYIN